MKIKWNQEYTTRAVYCFLVAAAIILFLLLLLNLGGIFDGLGLLLSIISPFIWGFAIAYILNRPLLFFENKVFSFLSKKKPRSRVAHGLSVAVVSILFIVVLAGLVWIILPQLAESVLNLVSSLPSYFQSFSTWLQDILGGFHIDTTKWLPATTDWEAFSQQILSTLKNWFPDIANAGINITVGVVGSVANFFIGFIASIYLMLSKDNFIMQIKKLLFGIFPKQFASNLIRVARDSHIIFSGFINGKLLESLIVGTLTFIAMTIIGIPYALLISVIMGVFNLIPFFGPFIGAIPSALLLLMVNPMDALWFVILTIVLQQIDGQIIGPKILSNSTGLTAFWVIFSIILGGGLFGVLGMILGVPVFAVIYGLFREFLNARLKKKGLSTRATDYKSQKNT